MSTEALRHCNFVLPVSNIWLNISEHHRGGLSDLHEHTIVDLEEAEKLHNFTGFRRDMVDTEYNGGKFHFWSFFLDSNLPLDTDNEVESRLGWNVEIASGS